MGVATIRKKLEAMEQRADDLAEQIQLEKAVAEGEAWFRQKQAEYNSPEARRIREAEYQAMLARGEGLKKECYRKWGEEI